MPSALDRIDFAPPRDVGTVRSFGLALLIHAALIAALTWGVNWKRTDSAATFGAELWSSPPAEAPRTIPTTPEPTPTPTPAPPPVIRPPAVQPQPAETPNVDIALEQEKERKRLKDQKQAQEKLERDKARLVKAEQLKSEQLKAEKIKTEKAKADQLAKAEKAEKAKADQLAKAERAKADQLAKAEQAKADALKEKQAQQAAAKQREANLSRMMANAGSAQGGGSSNRASAGGKGSSTTYGAIARAAVIPNVVFTEAIDGNPLTKVEVRLQSDGTIISSRVVQPSGNDSWDKAVLNAVVRTRVMPKDVDGKLPDTVLILEFRPRS